jgi:hypothetical protein
MVFTMVFTIKYRGFLGFPLNFPIIQFCGNGHGHHGPYQPMSADPSLASGHEGRNSANCAAVAEPSAWFPSASSASEPAAR